MIIRKNRAFLLIELLVTVIIVSVTVISINHAFTSSLRATALSNDYLAAVLLLEDKAFDFQLCPEAEEGEFSGEEEFNGTKFSWTESISPLEEEDLTEEYNEESFSLLKRLTFSLGWKRRNAERSIDILTYVRATEPME